ncbi:redoxin domain-containing protein [Nitrososphaera viennensis]|uniref:Disulfide bond oxidoreductase D family protein n=2 Tax=Nitrososphaera viennensis TaxID=1034015 RepID=A0A060HK32_9ARCH|nr:cytochrome c biogenesis protein CcdA [Nitrososphaera viennensis]AIC15655.1 Disulfide bond oxidoreductase D family protein [Nitrososphaera viennensis EN76]UVS70529.1 redoxin domain-containing protein [Nitrososphaera viennensis]
MRISFRPPISKGIALIAVGAVLLLVFPSLFSIGGGAALAQSLKPAPAYQATTLDGKQVSLEDLRGQVVVLNVWATWCVPCRTEMPGLEALQQDFAGSDFKVVGVSIDDAGADDRINSFLKSKGITYTIWRDPSDRFASTFRTIGVPESFLISKDGYVLHQWKGAFDPMSEDTRSRVQAALTMSSIVVGKDGKPAPAGGAAAAIEAPTVSAGVAFSAGLLSFLSPCVLPLIPSYAAFITGMSMDQLTGNARSENASSSSQQTRTARNTIIARGGLFVLGFSIVFVALGATISTFGFFFGDYAVWIGRIGGIMLMVFGLHLLGLLRIPGVEKEYLKMRFSKKPVGHAGAFLVGMGFGAGWTPCIGPILASILTLAATTSSVTQGTALLAIYSAGLAIPFMVSTVALDRFLRAFQKFRKWIPWVNRTSGILLIALGILLVTGSLALLSGTFGGLEVVVPGT